MDHTKPVPQGPTKQIPETFPANHVPHVWKTNICQHVIPYQAEYVKVVQEVTAPRQVVSRAVTVLYALSPPLRTQLPVTTYAKLPLDT